LETHIKIWWSARQKSGRALACVIAAFFWLAFSFGTFLLGNAKEKYKSE